MAKRPTGPKKACDDLFSRLVRSIGHCERCGSTEWLQCAHVITRERIRTRCDFENAMCLCAGCHRAQHDGVWLVSELIGEERYERVRARALDLSWKAPRTWWRDELERLRDYERRMAA